MCGVGQESGSWWGRVKWMVGGGAAWRLAGLCGLPKSYIFIM